MIDAIGYLFITSSSPFAREIFDSQILKKTGDKVGAYRGSFCCGEATRSLKALFTAHNVDHSNFVIVTNPVGNHCFLYDTTSPAHDPIIICPTSRQFFYYKNLEYVLKTFAHKDLTILENFSFFSEKLRTDGIHFQDSIGEKFPAIFYGPVKELRETIAKSFDEIGKICGLKDDLIKKMLQETLTNYSGPADEWRALPSSLEEKMKKIQDYKAGDDFFKEISKEISVGEALAIDRIMRLESGIKNVSAENLCGTFREKDGR